MFNNAILINFVFAVLVKGTSFDRVIKRACQQNPLLRYCSAKNEDDKRIASTIGSQSDFKFFGIKTSTLRDPVPATEVFRSSTREISAPEPEDSFCGERKAHYQHYCQSDIERPEGIQNDLFKFCINYERRCPQETLDKENDGDTPDALETGNNIKLATNAKGFIEEPAASPGTSEIAEYCEKYEPNFLYFCVGDDNDDENADKARLSRFCEVYAHDCPEKLKRIAGNFPAKSIKTSAKKENSGSDASEGEKNEEREIEDYCNEYSENFDYYCVQGNESDDKKTIEKFCKTYKNLCQNRDSKNGQKEEDDDDDDKRPPNPFEAFVNNKKSRPEEVFSAFKQPNKFAELAKSHRHSVPCTIDCDPKKHPHCTPECKCDFIYPAVQRFCNPPPMPVFLQTCRMWYTFCPKYKRYHYASQFIYSKSEKGKVNPAQTSPELRRRDIPIPFVGGLLGRVVRGARSREARAIRGPYNVRTLRDFAELANSAPQKQPFKLTADEVPPWQRVPYSFKIPPGQRPRAYQAGTEGNIHVFDKYTDSGGRELNQLHSRSPWTKPGLWEANPSNPHNRDHANKFSYIPQSVTADWLNGQVYWGGHWAVPAALVGGTNGFSAIHFPSFGSFFGIDDDYD